MTQAGVCEGCLSLLPRTPEGLCQRCSLSLTQCLASRMDCLALGFDRSWSPFCYADEVQTLIAARKEKFISPLSRFFAAEIAFTAPPDLLSLITHVVPVPADPLRRHLRGSNHSLKLASAIAAIKGWPLRQPLRYRWVDSRSPQHTLARSQRKQVPMPICGLPMAGRVLLVDDVLTTGATASVCAEALKLHGASEVVLVTAARAFLYI